MAILPSSLSRSAASLTPLAIISAGPNSPAAIRAATFAAASAARPDNGRFTSKIARSRQSRDEAKLQIGSADAMRAIAHLHFGLRRTSELRREAASLSLLRGNSRGQVTARRLTLM